MDFLCGSGLSRRVDQDKENFISPACLPGSMGWKQFNCSGKKQGSIKLDSITMKDTFTIVVKRGKNGYGFTVTGSSPARVGRVNDSSPSYLAGLRKDDCIIRINGHNVSQSVSDSIAMIVRHSEKQIILDVYRQNGRPVQSTHAPRQPLGLVNGQQHQNYMATATNKQPMKSQPFAQTHNSSYQSQQNSRHYQSSSQDSCSDVVRMQDTFSDSGLADIGRLSLDRTASTAPPSFQRLSLREQDRQTAIQKLLSVEEKFVYEMQRCSQQFSQPLRSNLLSQTEYETLFQQIDEVMSLSVHSLQCLTNGSIPYVDLHPEVQSHYLCVGNVYKAKITKMSQVYEAYCNGIKPAFELLSELREYQEFENFLKTASHDVEVTIHQYIQKPLKHIKDLVLCIQKILGLTELQHPDYYDLCSVLDTFKSSCNEINECNLRRSRSSLNMVPRSSVRPRSSCRSDTSSCYSTGSMETSSSYDSMESGSSTGSVSTPGMHTAPVRVTLASVDPEVMDIQTRLVFSEHVQAFQLATSTRHFIYSGELIHIAPGEWTKLFVVLMSDLLLVTKPQPDGNLLVDDYPILLHEVTNADFGHAKSADFVVTVKSSQEWIKPRSLILRAPNTDLKVTWKNLLEQRVAAQKLHHDLLRQGKIANVV